MTTSCCSLLLRPFRLLAGFVILLGQTAVTSAVAQQSHTTAKEPSLMAQRDAPRRVVARFVPTAWQVRCVTREKGGVACVLSRAVIEARTRQILVRVEIPDHRRFVTLQLPHGLDLRKSVQLLVDGKPLGKAPYFTSRRSGAFARMDLKGRILDTLRRGKSLTVKMAVFNGRDMTVRMDLKGFADALKKLR